VANELEAFVLEQMLYVASRTSKKIIEANDFRTLR
jgi:hypothetical protein